MWHNCKISYTSDEIISYVFQAPSLEAPSFSLVWAKVWHSCGIGRGKLMWGGNTKLPRELQSSQIQDCSLRVIWGKLVIQKPERKIFPHLRPSAEFKSKLIFLNKSKKTKNQEAFLQENKETRKKLQDCPLPSYRSEVEGFLLGYVPQRN